jgi:hypothetical protein
METFIFIVFWLGCATLHTVFDLLIRSESEQQES